MRGLLVIFLCVLAIVLLADGHSSKSGGASHKSKNHSGKHSGGSSKANNHSGKHSGGSSKSNSRSSKGSSDSSSDKSSDSDDHSNESSSGKSKGSGEKGGCKELHHKYYPDRGFILHNQESQTVIYIDYQESHIAWYCGQTGVIYLYISQTRILYVITRKTYATWNAKEKSFEEYFGNIYTLSELYEKTRSVAVGYDSETITRRTETRFVAVSRTLSIQYGRSCRAFQYIEETSLTYRETRLANYDKVYKNTEFTTTYDLQAYGETRRGASNFWSKVNGGWDRVVKSNVQVDQKLIYSFSSGFETSNYCWKQLAAANVDLRQEFKKEVSTEVDVLELISSSYGNVGYGYAGFVRAVSGCASFAHGRISEQELRVTLRWFIRNKRAVKLDYGKSWQTSITETKQNIEYLKLTESWKVVYTWTTNVEKKSWVVNDVDVYPAVDTLCQTTWTEGDVDKVVKQLKKKRNSSH